MKKLQRLMSRINKPSAAAYFFLLPSLVIFSLFILVPLVSSLGVSLFNLNIFLTKIEFVGLGNFRRLLADERFWNAMKNTLHFTGVQMPIQVVVGLVLAAYVSRNTWWRKLLRSVFFVPAVCSMTALAIVWSLLLDPVIGIIPYLLSILGIYGVEFLKDPALAMPSIILMTVWKNFGFTMVILVAGVQAIPGVYYEAAEIDGAGKIRQFFHVTVPLLLPTLGFCIITNTIGSFQVFDQVFVMTQGGPLYKTETVVQYIYNRGFHIAPYELGYASTVAVALFLVIAVTAFAINSIFLRREAEF